ncbi:MAG: M55 family metallopeptidase [Planctomycetota bacterium]|jgi:D-amino peptidase
MKVLIQTDLEGVAGVTTFGIETMPDGKYYEKAKRLLTKEVNAAVEGLVEEGVEEVLVVDCHGPGAIDFEELHPEALLFHGRPFPDMEKRTAIDDEYDVVIIIGQHAMAGNPSGNMNHTQSSACIDYYKLNGKFIGEIAQTALSAGAAGIPLIFLSGDDQACKEAEELVPGIVTAAVKKGTSRNSAITISMQKSHQMIKEGVKKAVKQHKENPVKPLVWEGPFELEKRYFHTDTVDGLMGPGVERIDGQTVRIKGENIRDVIYR